jgi:hypothetical protein
MSRPLFTSGKYPVPIVQEAGWTPGPVWPGAENFAPTGIRSPDRLARSQSLPTRLPGPHYHSMLRNIPKWRRFQVDSNLICFHLCQLVKIIWQYFLYVQKNIKNRLFFSIVTVI